MILWRSLLCTCHGYFQKCCRIHNCCAWRPHYLTMQMPHVRLLTRCWHFLCIASCTPSPCPEHQCEAPNANCSQEESSLHEKHSLDGKTSMNKFWSCRCRLQSMSFCMKATLVFCVNCFFSFRATNRASLTLCKEVWTMDMSQDVCLPGMSIGT